MSEADGSEDVNDFLLRIRELGDQRDKEDEERTRKLEQEILQGRKERQARRAGQSNMRWRTRKDGADRLSRARALHLAHQGYHLQYGNTPLDALHNGRVHAGSKQLTW